MVKNQDETAVFLHQWSARKMQPAVILYVAAVFVAFILVSYFIVHSMTAVKALAIAAVGLTAPLIPLVLTKIEYQLTKTGLEKRPLNTKSPGEFKEVLRWKQLDHIIPMKHGFKFYKSISKSNVFQRYWKYHVSDAFSGEVHLETEDRAQVLSIIERFEIPTSKP